MKKYVLMVLLMAGVASAIDFSIQPFGLVETRDLDHGKDGIGLSVLVNFTEYLGVEVEGYSFGNDGVFLDRGSASIRYNIVIPNSKTKPYLFGGMWNSFEGDEYYGYHAGVGVAHQFAKWFTPFVDVRFHKPIDGYETSPSCIARAGISIGF